MDQNKVDIQIKYPDWMEQAYNQVTGNQPNTPTGQSKTTPEEPGEDKSDKINYDGLATIGVMIFAGWILSQ